MPVVGKNIKKAMNQSYRIVFDSKRMKNTRDQQVLSELKKSYPSTARSNRCSSSTKKRTVTKLKQLL